MVLNFSVIFAVFLSFSATGAAQPGTPVTFADIADVAADAPVVAMVRVREARVVPRSRVPGLPADRERVFVLGDVQRLIRGTGGLPGQVRFVVDLPVDARGRTRKLKKRSYFVMARKVPGRDGELQLVAPDAMIAAGPEAARLVDAIVQEAVKIDAPPPLTGIASAFHVAGATAGEGETQIFIATATGEPISLTIIRRGGAERTWAVSLGELVESTAGQPAPNSLLWYRLACGALPATMPEAALSGASPAEQEAVISDYAFVRAALGACARNRR